MSRFFRLRQAAPLAAAAALPAAALRPCDFSREDRPRPLQWCRQAAPCLAEAKEKPLEFFIFGSPVTMSPSPEIHNAGFLRNGRPHRYLRKDVPDVRGVMQQLRQESCGGGSVTIPHKESILAELDLLSEAARVIGAVNTITKLPNGKLHGDNTDWIGIKNQLESRLPPGRSGGSKPVCLLCGAGGTARAALFAFKKMGAQRVIIYNRTTERAEALAKEFGEGVEVCKDLDDIGRLQELHFVVDTLPGASGFTLPASAVTALERCKPVVLEAAYIPRQTAFVKQALAAGCDVVEGVEMLFEQGCAQCEIWTAKPAPRQAIASNLLRELFTKGSSHPAHQKMEPLDTLPKSLVREAAAS
eukprot:TRINITY_DN78814_c0_g1_i1.p1 TRINITY_DN78814_c0_g1~~TRINITY_DN78814_c0_g1_i1.p1  ORF type:complete len:358 (-),score=59.11 TRINITY_DN78814_c0_g1_i1:400-1473(-)